MRKITGTVALLIVAAFALWWAFGARDGRGPSDDAPAAAGPNGGGGLVVDASGTPVAGVRVVAFTDRDPARPVAEEVTGTDGRFDLEPFGGTEVVALERGRRCSEWTDVPDGAESFTLALGRGATVRGTVRYERRRAAADVPVQIQLAAGPSPPAWTARTDADGRFEVSGIPEGWWVRPCIRYRARLGPAKREHGPHTRPAPAAYVANGQAWVAGGPGSSFERDLVARQFASAPYTFVLRFPDGVTPPRHVLVQTWDADLTGHSSGPEILEGDPPTFTRMLDVDREFVVRVRAPDHAGESDVLLAETEEARTVEIDMRPAPRVVARLVRGDGRPAEVEDVRVHVARVHDGIDGGADSAPTDATGRADVTWCIPFASVYDHDGCELVVALGGPGVFRARLLGDAPNLRVEGRAFAARVRSGEDPVVLDVPLIEPPRLTLTVTDDSGAPVPGVELVTEPGEPFWPGTATTDAEGRTTFDVLAPPDAPAWDEAAIAAQAPWSGSLALDGAAAEQLMADDGERTMVVHARRSVRVRVVDDTGAAVEGARVRAHGPSVLTDAHGIATVRAADGDSVVVSAEDHVVAFERVENGATEVRAVLERLREVTVRIAASDPEWEGVVRCEAKAASGTFRGGRAVLGPDGVGSLRMHLPVAPATVVVRSEDDLWEGRAEIAADAPEVDVVLARRRLHTVRLRILDGSGDPLVSRRLALRLQDRAHLLDRELVTDERGEIRVDLPALSGALLEYRLDDEPWDAVTLTVPPGGPVELWLSHRDR